MRSNLMMRHVLPHTRTVERLRVVVDAFVVARGFAFACTFAGAFGLLVLATLLPHVAMAQQAAKPESAASSGASHGESSRAVDPAPVAPFADPDTTRDLPGHGTFTRYTTPGQCLAAVIHAQFEHVRGLGPDTLYGPASMIDYYPAPVRDVGERCRTQVTTRQAVPIASRELQNVFTLATVLSDTVGGDAARERWIASPQTLADRGETIAETQAKRIDTAIKSYLFGGLAASLRKPYGTRAHTLFARLDAMGQPVRNQRLGMQQYIMLEEEGWTIQETGRLRDQRQALRDWLAFFAGVDSVGGLDKGAWKYNAGGFGPPLELVRARFVVDGSGGGVVPFADSVIKAMPHLSDFGALVEIFAHQMVDGPGNSVPTLHGSFWYHAGADTLWPTPGRFSLLVTKDMSAAAVARLRRLAATYGPKGLSMLVVVKTKGYWDLDGTQTGPRTAAQEAAQDSAYYLGHFQLPTALTVQEAKFTQLPNGWWQQAAPVQYERDWKSKGFEEANSMVMVDSTGKFFADLPLDEAYAYAFLDLMMGLDTHAQPHAQESHPDARGAPSPRSPLAK